MGRLHRLPEYDYGQTGYYFLTFCTKAHARVLSRVMPAGTGGPGIVGRDDLGAPTTRLSIHGKYLKSLIESIPNAYANISLHQYVIMPNHVHLLISIDTVAGQGAPRSSRPTQLVPRVITALKRFTNQKAGANLWQSTYHDHIIRSEADYLRVWNYIETNPAKWREDCYYEE